MRRGSKGRYRALRIALEEAFSHVQRQQHGVPLLPLRTLPPQVHERFDMNAPMHWATLEDVIDEQGRSNGDSPGALLPLI